ncbi:MAG: hypothetical protein Q9218_002723 [Villophora microphyllina]
MSVSNAPSPNAAASPQVLAPSTSSTANRHLASDATNLSTPSIFTHKEWVVPPRPKPGRKPAADAPPTKRKAQNREAQRSFRERRAARVGELEELMKNMEEEDTREQAQLRGRIQQLERDLEAYNQLLLSYQQRMQKMEASLNEKRELRANAESEVDLLRNGQRNSTDAVALPRRSTRQKSQVFADDCEQETQARNTYEDVPVGCGNCSQDTRCECIEQAFDISNITTNTPTKRPRSPLTDEENKRLRQEEPHGNEIDFTDRFATKKPTNLANSASTSSIPAAAAAAVHEDPCGFCSDGTPCICAEMALEATKSEAHLNLSRTNTSSSNQIPPDTSAASTNPCINGPGTCSQCLSDANSTLFCKSLAATRRDARPAQPTIRAIEETVASPPPTPTSHKDFHSSSSFNDTTNIPQLPVTGPTLSCADAYETLSRHPAFEQASMELSTWMPQLATVPGGRERTAFEVEAASVMGVLRFFDRRFGKSGRDVKGEQIETGLTRMRND